MVRAIADSDDEEEGLAVETHDVNVGAVLPKSDETRASAVAVETQHEKSTGSTGEWPPHDNTLNHSILMRYRSIEATD